MTHPLVYTHCLEIARTVCNRNGLELHEALEQKLDDDNDRFFVCFETASSRSSRFGLGEIFHEENGQVFIHLMAPKGKKTLDCLSLLEEFSTAFRRENNPDCPGLFFADQHTDPPSPDDTGNWMRFTLSIDFTFQNRITTS